VQTHESLKHTTWDCKYHVVFIPKCRRKRAGILSMPYAMPASTLPKEKAGVVMGMCNRFILLPQMAASGLPG